MFAKAIDGIRVTLGGAPRHPSRESFTDAAKALFAYKKSPEGTAERKRKIAEELAHPPTGRKWRWRRWASILAINLIFVLSFTADIQIVEGALTASRFFGFHMADLNASLQVMLAHEEVVLNLIIGTATVALFWLLVGGRAFCSWACPYHLLAEWAEMLHLRLAARGRAVDVTFDRRMRSVLWVVFAALAFVTGYTVFETISPVGVVSRALIYGASVALVWVGLLLLFEVFVSRRFWCRYACPIGLTYAAIGVLSPTQIKYDLAKCCHEGECRRVCMVPHALEFTKLSFADDAVLRAGPDCTRCGMCVDVCPTGALSFEVRGLSQLL